MDSQPPAITSAANPAVKMLKSLALKKHREAEGLFMVEGLRHITDGLAGGLEIALLAHAPRAAGDPLLAAARAVAGRTLIVTDDMLARITGRDNPQAAIAAFRIPRHALALARDGLWVALEGVRDPGNLGTIIRTADAAGADGVMLVGDCCDPWQPEAVRATSGSFGRVTVIQAAGADFLSWRRSWKGRVVGTHLGDAAIDYREAHYAAPLLLVMGSESSGLSPALAAACDTLVRIPMAGGTESLNLAIACGIMLYEIRRETL